MSQITLLKTIVQASGIFPTPQHRSRAIANLEAKISRRDRKIKACTQLTIFVNHGYTQQQQPEPMDWDVEMDWGKRCYNSVDDEDSDHCMDCDLPDACSDFGCAIKQEIRRRSL